VEGAEVDVREDLPGTCEVARHERLGAGGQVPQSSQLPQRKAHTNRKGKTK